MDCNCVVLTYIQRSFFLYFWLISSSSQNSANLFRSLDESMSPENTHSSAAYALSSSYHTKNGSYNDNGYNRGTPMTSQTRRINKQMHHRLEEQQDEFFEL